VDGQYIQNKGDLPLRRSPFLYILTSRVTCRESFAIACYTHAPFASEAARRLSGSHLFPYIPQNGPSVNRHTWHLSLQKDRIRNYHKTIPDPGYV